ncbi:MAG: hypothetical protein KDA58_11055 [Planctomycetaceae bacterium]|nr:hypothetical protein [Planctomycetaceae bacterium]
MTRCRLLPRLLLLTCLVLIPGCGGSTTPVDNKPTSDAITPQPEDSIAADSVATDPTANDAASSRPVAPIRMRPAAAANADYTAELDTTVKPRPVYRPSDNRPQRDEQRAAELGIARYASSRLILYTDLPAEKAKHLPALVDALYTHWVDYFGDLLPNREGTEYQLTGYLMQDPEAFRAAGMLPENLPFFAHGRHLGLEFWLNEQEFDYYREHLVLHEATHCFMTTMPGPLPPLWYMEGMAERFALHRADEHGRSRFAVFPTTPQLHRGFGGIELIRRELREQRGLSVTQITQLSEADFARSKTVPYAWSWLLCHFLSTHPRYQQRFQQLGQHLSSRAFYDLQTDSFRPDLLLLEAEWTHFVQSLDYGLDVATFAIPFAPTTAVGSSDPFECAVDASRGWQSSGLSVAIGDRLTIEARGRVVVAHNPRPWESERQGITIRYVSGRPVGRLLGLVLPSVDAQGLPLPAQQSQPLQILDLGEAAEFDIPATGTLYLRVNDDWRELEDNIGTFDVSILRKEPTQQ